MSEQSNNNSGGPKPQGPQGAPGNPGTPNPNRRPNNRRRHNNNNKPRDAAAPGQGNNPNQAPRQGQNPNQPQRQGQHPNQKNNNPNQRRPQHNNNNNRPRPQGQGQGPGPVNTNSTGFGIERIYEKYLNLLDQHIIARRKYHDLFFRADPPQKNKLERNFYNTLNDIREFESKLAPDVKTLFEKRNNGYQYDRTYTSNHEIPIEGDVVPEGLPPAEPHYLQSQIAADYKDDTEESVGTADDYLKYKGF